MKIKGKVSLVHGAGTRMEGGKMEDINSLKVMMIGKEKEIEDTEKELQLYARGYTFNPAIFHPELWRWGLPTIRVQGWNEQNF